MRRSCQSMEEGYVFVKPQNGFLHRILRKKTILIKTKSPHFFPTEILNSLESKFKRKDIPWSVNRKDEVLVGGRSDDFYSFGRET